MANKWEGQALVRKQAQIGDGIFDLTLQADEIAARARAGQFVSLYCRDGARILPRPVSLCEINAGEGTIRLVYRVAGKGTKEFSGLREGDAVRVLGPLGNGFSFRGKSAFLIGGGIGIPPMLELAKELNEKEYNNAFFARGTKSRELIPKVYIKVAEDKYRLSGRALNNMSDDDERVLASCVKGRPWGTGSRTFMRTFHKRRMLIFLMIIWNRCFTTL